MARLRAMPPRRRWLNIGLAALLVALLVVTALQAGSPETPTETARTALVSRGTVTEKVNSTGNTEESLTIEVNFENAGTINAINVRAGDTVQLGQVLASIDPATAQLDLRNAQADRDNARAAYDQARSGPTDVARRQDQESIAQAERSVTNAKVALGNAREQLALDRTSTATAIANAEDDLANTRRTQNDLVADAQQNLSDCRSGRSTSSASTTAGSAAPTTSAPSTTTSSPSTTTRPPSTTTSSSRTTTSSPSTTASNARSDTTGVVLAGPYTGGASTWTVSGTSDDDNDCTSQQQALSSAENTRRSSIDSAQQAVTTARQGRDSTLLNDQKAIDDAEANLITAQGNVTSARLTAEGEPGPRGPVPLDRLATDAVADLRAVHPRRSVTLHAEPDCVVTGDADQLRQVIANLLANATGHTPATSSIRVTVRAGPRNVLLIVDDDGPGLTPREAAHVFDRFWRADTARSRARGGSGLGLPIVDALVTAHAGTVGFDTSPATGTTVCVDLPLAVPDQT